MVRGEAGALEWDGARVIDVHAHWIPDSALDAFRRGATWHGSEMALNERGFPTMVTEGRRSTVGSLRHFDGIDARIEDMDAAGVDVQVLSVLPPFFRYTVDASHAAACATAINDELASVVSRHPNRFRAWGHVPLQADRSVVADELRRLSESRAFVGVEIGTHVAGRQLADESLAHFWDEVANRDLAVFLHPPAGDRRPLDLPKGFFLDNVIGNPVETTLALASLLLSGILEEHPTIRIVAAHGGGYFPAALGRLKHAASVRDETARLLSAPMSRAGLNSIWVDSITHSGPALRFLLEQLGSGQVVLGTDYPSDMSTEDPVRFVREATANMPPEICAGVLGANAGELLAPRTED